MTLLEAWEVWWDRRLPETAVILGVTVLWWGRIGVLLMVVTYPLLLADVIGHRRVRRAGQAAREAVDVSNIEALNTWLDALFEQRDYAKKHEGVLRSADERKMAVFEKRLGELSASREAASQSVRWKSIWLAFALLVVGIVIAARYFLSTNYWIALVLALILVANLWKLLLGMAPWLLRAVVLPLAYLMEQTTILKLLVWGLGLVGTLFAFVVA